MSKGLSGWDSAAAGCTLAEQIGQLADGQLSSSIGQNGDIIIELKSEQLAVEVLINPHLKTAVDKISSFAATVSRYRYLVHAGPLFQTSGSWLLQDGALSYGSFAESFRGVRNGAGSVDLAIVEEGPWTSASLAKLVPDRVRVNPQTNSDPPGESIVKFAKSVVSFCIPHSSSELLPTSDVFGSITFSKPTLYIFPSGEGSSAVFSIRGFSLLVDGGYGRQSSFWNLVRHLERIDATVITHFGEHNILGFSSFLDRRTAEDCGYPILGPVFVNSGDSKPVHNDAAGTAGLLVNVADESAAVVRALNKLNVQRQHCVAEPAVIRPINLYYKVGFGSLDLYALNPATDNKELKEYVAGWTKTGKPSRSTASSLSVCVMLVFKPAAADSRPTRILFPGAVSQTKLFECLDRLKTIQLFQNVQGSEKPTASANKPTGARTNVAGVDLGTKAVPAKSTIASGEASHPTGARTDGKSSRAPAAAEALGKTSRPQTGASESASKDTKKSVLVEHKKSSDGKDSKPVVTGTSAVDSKKPTSAGVHKDVKPAQLPKGHDKDGSEPKRSAAVKSQGVKSDMSATLKISSTASKKPEEVSKKAPVPKKTVVSATSNGKSQTGKAQVKAITESVNGAASAAINETAGQVENGHGKDVAASAQEVDDSVVPELVEAEQVARAQVTISDEGKASEVQAAAAIDDDEKDVDTAGGRQANDADGETNENNTRNGHQPTGEYAVEEPVIEADKQTESFGANRQPEDLVSAETHVTNGEDEVQETAEAADDAAGTPSAGIPSDVSPALVAVDAEDAREDERLDEDVNAETANDDEIGDVSCTLEQDNGPSDADATDTPDVIPQPDEPDQAVEELNPGEQPRADALTQQELRQQPAAFDPARDWGEPLALPAPVDEKKAGNNPASATADQRKGFTSGASAAASKKAEFKVPAPKLAVVPKKETVADKLNSTEIVLPDSCRRPSTSDISKRTRLSLQPGEIKQMAARDQHSTKPAAASAKLAVATPSSGVARKLVPSKPVIPCYVDLAFLPTMYGQSIDAEFFMRVRARRYVVSAADPNPRILAYLAEAKKTWEGNVEVALLPTSDAHSMYEWFQANLELMNSLKISLGPSASRCSVDLQGSTFAANRLEF